MKLPRISIRETLLLTTIVALSIPYVYQALVKPSILDLSNSRLQYIISQTEPMALLHVGSGDNDFSDMTYWVPPASAPGFVKKIHSKIESEILAQGWSVNGSGKTDHNGEVTQFSYHLVKGKSQCNLRLVQIFRKEASPLSGDNDEIRIMLFVSNTNTQ